MTCTSFHPICPNEQPAFKKSHGKQLRSSTFLPFPRTLGGGSSTEIIFIGCNILSILMSSMKNLFRFLLRVEHYLGPNLMNEGESIVYRLGQTDTHIHTHT